MHHTIMAITAITLFGAAIPALAADTHQYIIERTIPGAQNLSADELKAISQKSRAILESMGPGIKWEQSYVAEDKLYCVYEATDKDIIARHAKLGGFPVDQILEVSGIIGPQTAEE